MLSYQVAPLRTHFCCNVGDLIMTLAERLNNLEGKSNSSDNLVSLDDDAVSRLRESVETAGGLPITLDCRDKILAVSHTDINEVILPLCAWLEGLVKDYVETGGGGGRLLIGIVGPAAAGKSTLSQLLCAACTILWGSSLAQCVSMDGYSFPNSYLLAEQVLDHRSNPCTLKDIKGLPNTLDVDALLRDLLRLRTAGRETVLLPSYDRDLHDPVPDSVSIATDCKVVIVEGLHLLHREGSWKDVSESFCRTIFLDIERSCCFQRVVERKVANGRSRESSEAHFDRVDGPTFDQLQKEKNNANLILALRPTSERPLNIVDVIVQVSPKSQREGTKPK